MASSPRRPCRQLDRAYHRDAAPCRWSCALGSTNRQALRYNYRIEDYGRAARTATSFWQTVGRVSAGSRLLRLAGVVFHQLPVGLLRALMSDFAQ